MIGINYCADILFQSTLPQGERRPQLVKIAAAAVFQSTLPQGERRNQQPLYSTFGMFQSTLPQGERLYHTTHILPPRSFNPRSRRGSDGRNGIRNCYSFLFQSTLPQGERQVAEVDTSPQSLFQSTLPQGERLMLAETNNKLKVSIHAPAGGATYNCIN